MHQPQCLPRGSNLAAAAWSRSLFFGLERRFAMLGTPYQSLEKGDWTSLAPSKMARPERSSPLFQRAVIQRWARCAQNLAARGAPYHKKNRKSAISKCVPRGTPSRRTLCRPALAGASWPPPWTDRRDRNHRTLLPPVARRDNIPQHCRACQTDRDHWVAIAPPAKFAPWRSWNATRTAATRHPRGQSNAVFFPRRRGRHLPIRPAWEGDTPF